ncbi:tRNA uridine-5-carboxymethylaminomethyl(34) synthesis GTPase MnmE [Notoacmeibacter sp. MSK16QG-6]|uniref:tRNA uridine-5-carboxymethylaminomethyl(34) synthesis GTPase MnmE n=1 Tax=Notoacmeibacter sp. MSK16QG-6 TaxID=2957982 RepID=UPI00209D1A58|nr:tRNA uridine-5-carboxymethylaminomethyl(34) synthesis GTPase MnmE [Notoacmeibacter sp. MSK16QG-6]MCP1199109.1 tRNA uridine-5-carboxymethylaminomethyl(34) synthesis GTPase MnmE [Notoacmeibacter sp. MSK16QG-6]
MADTIYALSSGAVPSGVAIVRISGERAVEAFTAFGIAVPEPRRATLHNFVVDGEVIDRGLVLFFAGPHSFTGEDCAEFQLHGSPAIIAAVLRRLSSLPTFRPAEAGEFTRRAFANGRMDLTEAEALSQLIDAETEAQRRLAMSGAVGRQLALISGWQKTLTRLRARLEAELDFSDEGDVPAEVSEEACRALGDLVQVMERHHQAFAGAEIVRRGFRVALAGLPNAGKSSLLNFLAGRDVALVTDVAGTTRDRIEVNLDLEGYKVVLSDLAGLRDTDDVVERMGVNLALQTARDADLVLWLDEKGREPQSSDFSNDVLKVQTKADMASMRADDRDWISISTKTGEGIASLLALIVGRLRDRLPFEDAVPPATDRQRHHLASSIDHCNRALSRWNELPAEMIAEELRAASFALGRLVGQTDAEDVLDEVFSAFCIGK